MLEKNVDKWRMPLISSQVERISLRKQNREFKYIVSKDIIEKCREKVELKKQNRITKNCQTNSKDVTHV